MGGVINAQVKDTCEVWFNDTLAYVDAKTSAYSGISINQINDAGFANHGYAGYAEKFEAPDTITLLGMCFYGVMDSGADGLATVNMYDVSGGMPNALIASTTQVIPFFGTGYTGAMNDGSILQCAMFSSPVEWEGDYILSVENHSTSDMYITRNATGDGAMEDISYTYYEGVTDPTYDGWYRMYSDFGSQWDFDFIFRPVVSYQGQSILTYDTAICLGDTLNLTHEFMLDDSVLYNKFYNPNFATYNGVPDSIGFDYGDMSVPTVDTFHTYNAGGTYSITYTIMASTGGWGTDNFLSQCVYSTEVIDPYYDILDQSACVGDSVYFIATSGYDAYTWSDMSTDDSLLVETNGMSNGDYMYYVDYELSGCSSSDTMTLTIGDLLVDLGGDTTLCLNQNVMLTAGTFDSYDWNTGQTTESIQVGPFVSAGVEEIILTVTQGSCSGSDTLLVTVDNCLGIEQPSHIALEVFPNPSNGKIFVNSEATVQKVILRSLSGSVIGEWSVKNGDALILPNLADGTYLIQVETSEGTGYKKIQIIH